VLADNTLSERLLGSADGRPDLAIVDSSLFHRCVWILCVRLNIPYISFDAMYEPWLWRVPALPSFVPFPFAVKGTLTEKMTFWERVANFWTLLDWTVWPRLEQLEDSFVQKYLPNETYATLASRSKLWFYYTDFVVDYPRPTMPNEV
jgi:UDP-glucoronosyl and UDP-glucosyl transferase